MANDRGSARFGHAGRHRYAGRATAAARPRTTGRMGRGADHPHDDRRVVRRPRIPGAVFPGLLPAHPHLLLRLAAGLPRLAGRRLAPAPDDPPAATGRRHRGHRAGHPRVRAGDREGPRLTRRLIRRDGGGPARARREPSADPRRRPVVVRRARHRRRCRGDLPRDRRGPPRGPGRCDGRVVRRARGLVRNVHRRDRRDQPRGLHGDRQRQDHARRAGPDAAREA